MTELTQSIPLFHTHHCTTSPSRRITDLLRDERSSRPFDSSPARTKNPASASSATSPRKVISDPLAANPPPQKPRPVFAQYQTPARPIAPIFLGAALPSRESAATISRRSNFAHTPATSPQLRARTVSISSVAGHAKPKTPRHLHIFAQPLAPGIHGKLALF